jgi:hypothetical protein
LRSFAHSGFVHARYLSLRLSPQVIALVQVS